MEQATPIFEYDLEIDKAVEKIRKEDAQCVCIQLPDGLKDKAHIIADALEEKTDARIVIWAGSCYGACDLPLEVQHLGCDLLIQWGHTEWRYYK